jgi:amidase
VNIPMPDLMELLRTTSVIDAEFKFDLADYLAAAPNAPIRSLGEILERGLYHQALDATFRRRNGIEARDTEGYRTSLARREAARKAILEAMDAEKVTALVYPTIRRKAALVGEAQGGANCQLSPTTGLPALTVPAGFTPDGLPVGIEFVGRPFTESDLLKLGDAFERATRARRPPPSTPPLPADQVRVTAQTERPAPRQNIVPAVPTVIATFRQPSPNILAYEVTIIGVSGQDVLLLALHRTPPSNPPGAPAAPNAGYLSNRLLRTGEIIGRGEITLRDADREDLAAGRLSIRLFTRQQPFGLMLQAIAIER